MSLVSLEGADPAVDCDAQAIKHKCPRDTVLSPKLREFCETVSQLPDIPVLLSGESGTGKGVLAKEIGHFRRQHGGNVPFVSLNCALLNNDVADSTLFGHCRGAFTGAHGSAAGAVSEADGGVLFLDEIHCLSINSQRKLLRVVDEGVYTVVGETAERRARFQLITASNQDLRQLVARGDFMFDFLMRIQGIEIRVPPLRERLEELPDLIAVYFTSRQTTLRRRDLLRLVEICQPLFWPGNVRQLYKALGTARFKARMAGDTEYAPHFVVTQAMCDSGFDPHTPTVPAALKEPAPSFAALRDSNLRAPDFTLDADSTSIHDAIAEILKVLDGPIDSVQLLASLESRLLRYALKRHRSIKDVMSHLRLSRGQLDFKRRKYNLMEYCNGDT